MCKVYTIYMVKKISGGEVLPPNRPLNTPLKIVILKYFWKKIVGVCYGKIYFSFYARQKEGGKKGKIYFSVI